MPSEEQKTFCTPCRINFYIFKQEQAVEPLKAYLDGDKGILEKIAVLLSSHKVCDAAALATAAGNVRLAILIIQVDLLPTSLPLEAHMPLTSASMLVRFI